MAVRNLFCLLVFMFLFSSCANSPEYAPLTTSWSERQQQLSTLTDWQFRGHVIFKMPERKFSANVYWQQKTDVYKVMLFGPLGVNAVNLEGQTDLVSLKDSHGQVYSAKTPEALMQQQLRWSLPISSLYYWVRGLPAPGAITRVTYDAYHRISHLEQQGWSIDYVAYQRVQFIELPQEITVTQDHYYLRLMIDSGSWQLSGHSCN